MRKFSTLLPAFLGFGVLVGALPAHALPGENSRVSLGQVSLPPVSIDASATELGRTVSQTGAFVVFSSESAALVSGDTNGYSDIFFLAVGGTPYRINLGIGGAEPNGPSWGPSISHQVGQYVASEDARFVVYESDASNLVVGDTNGTTDVFRFDRGTRTTVLVSRASGPGGAVGNNQSFAGSVSHDGRYVVFESSADNLVPGDTNGTSDVFVHDLQTQTTTLVSRASGPTGVQGNANSNDPVISADGRYVAFSSFGTNLVAGDTNGDTDVFVRDLATHETTLVSRASGAGGVQGNAFTGLPSISADGRYVAFESSATNLVPGVVGSNSHVYVYDRNALTTTLVSRGSGPAGNPGNASSENPSISADGRYVAFDSAASNLVAGDANGYEDTFLYDLATQTTALVSTASGSLFTQGNGDSYSVSISGDGRVVAYTSNATNLVADDSNGQVTDVFVRNVPTQDTLLASRAVGAFGDEGNSSSWEPSISADGRFVAFTSVASNLVTDDSNGVADIFVYDRQGLTTERVNRASGVGGAQADMASERPSISADGRFVAFASEATNLVPGDDNLNIDVFVYDRQTQSTSLISRPSGGLGVSNGSSFAPALSANGRFVAFISDATDLVAGDTNGLHDVFVHDRNTQTTQLISRASGAGGAIGNGSSNVVRLAISDDGRYVAFGSNANNLVPDDTNNTTDVFLYDRDVLSITLISRAVGSGVPGNSDSWYPSISGDGRYVVYRSRANNLVSGDANGTLDVFLYDRDQGTTTLVSRASGTTGVQGNGVSSFPTISADGRRVAFFSQASNLVPGDTNGPLYDWYMRDLQTQTVALVSRAYDGSFTAGETGGGFCSVSGDGQFVAYWSTLPNIVVGDTNGFADAFVWEAIEFTDTTPPFVTPTVSGPLGSNGWYTGDVSLSWTVLDPESTVSSVTGCNPGTVTADTTGAVFSCAGTSDGGTNSVNLTIRRDATAPTAQALRTPLPNALGWNSGAVTVTYTGQDATSGIGSCTGQQELLAEGAGQSTEGVCTDNAGNASSPVAISGINIDLTAPAVTATRDPVAGNAAGWNNVPVTVSFSGTDALSGVPVAGCAAPVARSTDGAGQSATGDCSDRAGNSGSATLTGINVDRTPPVATAQLTPAPNGAGWNRTNTTVSFNGTDAISGSGVASCSAAVPVTTETSGQLVSGTCTDLADNVSAPAAVTVRVDATPPTATVTVPQAGASYPRAGNFSAAYACADVRSGVASCTGTVANGAAIDTASEGAKVFAVTAIDVAGNQTTVQVNYTVVPNAAPVAPASIPAQTATEGASYGYAVPQFSDPNGDVLTYAFSGLPAWLRVYNPTANPRYLQGTPPYSESGANSNRTYWITVTATDPGGLRASRSFSLTVQNVNAPPTRPDSIPAQTALEGQYYGYSVPIFPDPDGDAVSYSFSGLPSWLTVYNPASNPRYLYGRPPATESGPNVNKVYWITVTASDPHGNTSSRAFSLTVQNVNNPPVAPVIPDATAIEGQYLSYTAPRFFDPDYDTLTYSFTGLPSWLTVYNPTSNPRFLYGRPPTGTASQSWVVTLTATDPSGGSASQTFTVRVQAP